MRMRHVSLLPRQALIVALLLFLPTLALSQSPSRIEYSKLPTKVKADIMDELKAVKEYNALIAVANEHAVFRKRVSGRNTRRVLLGLAGAGVGIAFMAQADPESDDVVPYVVSGVGLGVGVGAFASLESASISKASEYEALQKARRIFPKFN